MPDDTDINELSQPIYRKLDVEIKRPSKLAEWLWLAAGIAFAVLLLLMIWVAYHHQQLYH